MKFFLRKLKEMTGPLFSASTLRDAELEDPIITKKTIWAAAVLLILLLILLALFLLDKDPVLPEAEEELFNFETLYPDVQDGESSALRKLLDAEVVVSKAAPDISDIPPNRQSLPNPPDDLLKPLPRDRNSLPRPTEYFGRVLSKNEQDLKNDLLQGVFYDLKLTKDLRPTPDFRNDSKQLYDDARIPKFLKVMTPFAKGKWTKAYNQNGEVHYPELDKFYASPTRLWNSFFLIDEKIEAKNAPTAFNCGKEVEQSAWVCIYSGIVEAPFTGKFRFLGFCDDALIVRFNGKIVLDHGWSNYISSEYKTGCYPTRNEDSAGLGQGLPIDVKKGQTYPIEIMFSEIPGGHFTLGVFFERLDSKGRPPTKDPVRFPLFRTTSDLPEQPKRLFPDFDPDGPVWHVASPSKSGR